MLDLGKEILQSQPFSCKLGTQITLLEKGRAILELELKEDLKQQHGFAHGGVVSYLADNCLTFAGGTQLGAFERGNQVGGAVTSEYKINYMRPAIGERLIAQSTVVYAGKTQAVCQCEVAVIQNGEKKVIAVAQGTICKV